MTPYEWNNYGSHPFYLSTRAGKSHGVFLLSSNGMDVNLKRESLTYRVVGGVFDFYFFVGPSAEQVVQQYQEVIGRPYLMQYWTLGFHQCKYGYTNIAEVRDVVAGFTAASIPLEAMWIDIDLMDAYKCWTLDPVNYPLEEVRALTDQLHAADQHFVTIQDPGIKQEDGYKYYDVGVRDGVFLRQGSNPEEVYIGSVWPGPTAFPDFFHPNGSKYWEDSIRDYLELLPQLDGLWVDMNEVANFLNQGDGPWQCSHEALCNPPYDIHNRGDGSDSGNNGYKPLSFFTIDVDTLHYGGVTEYDAHNLYGLMETISTKEAMETLTGERAFVLSRSTFPGSGAHAGHWTGDNNALWEDMYWSLPAMLNHQLYGIPYVGADICGFAGDTTEELCGRWMQVGAFYPFSRNHNSKGQLPQEPYLWDSVAEISRIAIGIRYQLLPYYYTLFEAAHATGGTVLRPLFFEFPNDPHPDLPALDRQFLIGSAVMVSPVLEEGRTSVKAYIPEVSKYG